jgi:formate hydrogenlyase transcriptional activator
MIVKGFARRAGRPLDHLRSYPWPGNVRELQNVIERSVIVCDTDEFTVDDSWLSAWAAVEGRLALSGTLAAHEKAIIEEALRVSGGRVFGPSGAAARLGIPRSTLESKIRALKINKSRFRARRRAAMIYALVGADPERARSDHPTFVAQLHGRISEQLECH